MLSDNIQVTGSVLKLNVARLPTVNRVEEVARELVGRIRSGEWQPDTRLPSEQSMADQFGVSRTVIREAIARLKNEGLVVTRQGSGAFVRDWQTSSLHLGPEISKSLKSVLFIAELRKGIEAEAAALAAERRTHKDLAAIEKALCARFRNRAGAGRQHASRHGISSCDCRCVAQSRITRPFSII